MGHTTPYVVLSYLNCQDSWLPFEKLVLCCKISRITKMVEIKMLI